MDSSGVELFPVEIEYEPETVPRNQSPILLMYSASRPRERP